ncbi:hypothetical protein D9M71_203130 [compost metagenome]
MDRSRPAKPELVCSADHASASPCPDGILVGLGKRLYRWRKARLVRRALRQADEPNLVLDLSHETGSFWPVLAEHGNRVILAATASPESLSAALGAQPAALAARVKGIQGGAAAIQLHDNAVDSIFCLGLLPLLAEADQRLAILRELRRVTRDTLIVSLQLDGWRQRGGGVKRATIEEEIGRVGFDIVGRYGFLPGYSTLWVYVLRKED